MLISVTRYLFILICLLLSSGLLASYSYANHPISNIHLDTPSRFLITEDAQSYDFTDTKVDDNLAVFIQDLSTKDAHYKVNTFGDHFVSVIKLTNQTDVSEWFVYPSGSIIQHIEIVAFSSSLHTQRVVSGHRHKNEIDYHYGGTVVLPEGETVTLAILYDSDMFTAPIQLSVLPKQEALSRFDFENQLLVLSIGACIALALYNLFLFAGTRQLQYLFYSLATVFFTLGWAQLFGMTHGVFAGGATAWTLLPFLPALGFIAAFVITFLNLKATRPNVYKALTLCVAVGFLSIPLPFFHIGLGVMVAITLSTCILTLSLYAGTMTWIRGYSPAKYFVIALLFVLIPNLLGNLVTMGVIPPPDMNLYLMAQLGHTLDSLLLAFALAEKVQLMNKRNRKLKDELEDNVELRTQQLSEANAKLETLIADLKQADSTKNAFLANMSHEIRTPLTSIIGYADGLLEGDVDRQEQEKFIRIISQNGNHLLAIINDVLDLTKIEANKLTIERIPTPLAEVIEQVASLVQLRARNKGIQFSLECAFPLPETIMVDPTRLKQILFNLTNNAVKFTESGQISFRIFLQKNTLCFEIEDTGIGMDARQLDSVFEPFEQGDSATSRQFGGSGLGLSISRHLARIMGGEISVTSDKGSGSLFTLTLPMGGASTGKMINSLRVSPTETAIVDTQLPNFGYATVLLVDDHANNRDLVTRILSKYNVNVIEADTGNRALHILRQTPEIDLVLMDIQMPDIDGPETLRRMRHAKLLQPVVALTANSMAHEVALYMEQGFSAHIKKPLIKDEMLMTLKQFLSYSSEEDDLLSQSERISLSDGFYKELIEQMRTLRHAYDSEDYETVKLIAHSIKGSASAFGFSPYTLICDKLEQSLKENKAESAASHYNALCRLHALTMCAAFDQLPSAIANNGNDLQQVFGHIAIHLPAWKKNTEFLQSQLLEQHWQEAAHTAARHTTQYEQLGMNTIAEMHRHIFAACATELKDVTTLINHCAQIREQLQTLTSLIRIEQVPQSRVS